MTTLKMTAKTSIKATPTRKAVARGASFEATGEQEARDLERMGQAVRVAPAATADPAPGDKAKGKGKTDPAT